MSRLLPLRIVLALAVALGFMLWLLVLLFLTDYLFKVWDRLQQAPTWLSLAYAAVVIALSGIGGYLVWRLVAPRSRRMASRSPAPPPTEAQVLERLQRAQGQGLPVEAARREMEELRRRRGAGEVYVALFGQISTGKSSLVRALLPDAAPQISARGGTTREVTRYVWSSPAGDRLILTDLPGLDEEGGALDVTAREEALRAHVVIYVCDGDLSRDQYREVQALLALDKPLVLALNKMDRYTDRELAVIRERLTQRVTGAGRVELVAISAGGSQEVTRVYPDGREERVERERPARVDDLAAALQRRIDGDLATLEKLRDSAVFVLTQRKLDEALRDQRRAAAQALVGRYSRRAVLGAMAAVAPGTDLVIQGYLGINLIKELCALYEVPARDLDVQRFLDLASDHVGKTLPLLLAVAGNALKAFPGVGTLAGGAVHALAYGMVFDSLGRAVSLTLESRGELVPAPATALFEVKLGEDLEARARHVARLALAARPEERGDTR